MFIRLAKWALWGQRTSTEYRATTMSVVVPGEQYISLVSDVALTASRV
jgi:hypothetical protein